MERYYTYILLSQKINRYYIGFTTDLQDRVARHNRALKGYTSKGQPWNLMYYETFATKSEALRREKQLKRWKSLTRIRELIEGKSNHEHPDISLGESLGNDI